MISHSYHHKCRWSPRALNSKEWWSCGWSLLPSPLHQKRSLPTWAVTALLPAGEDVSVRAFYWLGGILNSLKKKNHPEWSQLWDCLSPANDCMSHSPAKGSALMTASPTSDGDFCFVILKGLCRNVGRYVWCNTILCSGTCCGVIRVTVICFKFHGEM